MKSLTLRASVVLACVLSLAGCGGNNKTLLLSGSIVSLAKTGLVLQNNGELLTIASGATTFSFVNLLSTDEDFNITIQSQPAGAVCAVTNGAGKTGAYNITSVIVSCATNMYQLGGTVSGLGNASGLVVINGADRKTIAPGATSFNMTILNADGTYASGKVADGAPYGLSVLTQPTGVTCTVQNGVGTMGSADSLSSIQIVCS